MRSLLFVPADGGKKLDKAMASGADGVIVDLEDSIAPERKADPGELFDWPRLARAGIGLWPEPDPQLPRRRGRGVGIVERARALASLARIGYPVTPGDEAPALAAFQRRFRPQRWDGRLDAETALRLAEVHAAYDDCRHALARRRRERFNAYRRMN